MRLPSYCKSSLLLFLCILSFVTAQISCPRGTRISLNKKKCIRCRPGTYSNLPNSLKCTKCPKNTFNPLYGVQVRRMCIPCGAEARSSSGSSSCKRCKWGHVRVCGNKCLRCPPGTYINQYSCKCEKCDEEVFSSGYNWMSCESCPQRWLYPRQPQRDRCEKLPCKDGFQHDEYGVCEPCTYRKYRNGSMNECIECPRGEDTSSFSGPNSKCIACPPGRYMTDYVPQAETNEHTPHCSKCPEGWTTNGFGKSLCHKIGSTKGNRCPVNTFVDEEGDCHSCWKNQKLDVQNKKCIDCPKNYVSEGGLSTKCIKCLGGQIPFENHDLCVCPIATVWTKLPSGRYRCKKCPRGTYFSRGALGCITCPSGFTSKIISGISYCFRCPPGTTTGFNPKGQRCRRLPKCSKGFLPAPIGRNQYFKEFTCVSGREGCKAGEKLVARGGKLLCQNRKTKEIVCPDPKTQLFDGKSMCISCERDFYARKKNNGIWSCVKCPKNQLSNGGAVKQCQSCLPGFQLLDIVYPPGRVCSCSTGRFVDSGGTCKVCPNRTYNRRGYVSECRPCGKGAKLTDNGDGPSSCSCSLVVNFKGECVNDTFKGPVYPVG